MPASASRFLLARRAFLGGVAAALCAGCRAPWTAGEVVPGLPRHTERFAAGTVFRVDAPELRVKRTLEEALVRRGFALTSESERADILLKVEISHWEYNDAGFSGLSDRDDMTLSVTFTDVPLKRIVARYGVRLASDFRILDELVEEL